MEFSCRCHSTTGGITSSTLLPLGLWAPGMTDVVKRMLTPGGYILEERYFTSQKKVPVYITFPDVVLLMLLYLQQHSVDGWVHFTKFIQLRLCKTC